MKKIILIFMFAGAFSIQVSANYSAKNMITIIAANNQILEMPIYQESEIIEVIPGKSTQLCCQNQATPKTAEQLLEPKNLSKILLCISKPEETVEPFPFEIN